MRRFYWHMFGVGRNWTGIGLMFNRLSQVIDTKKAEMAKTAQDYLPALDVHHPRPGHSSPLDTAVGPAMVYIIYVTRHPTKIGDSRVRSRRDWDAAISTIRNAVNMAIIDETLGGDEVLYVKAGLLWGMLNLHYLSTQIKSGHNKGASGKGLDKKLQEIREISGTKAINSVFNRILRSGIAEAQGFKDIYESTKSLSPPLMWSWHGKYYVGA